MIKYKRNDYGGIDVVELNERFDTVYINGELVDDYDSIEEYLSDYGSRLWDNIVDLANDIANNP